MASYIRPGDVTAPRQHWGIIAVLDSGKEGTSALAIGRWDNNLRLAMRWNGFNEEGREIGNPQSRGLPTWFIIEQKYYVAILGSGVLTSDTAQRIFSDELMNKGRTTIETYGWETEARPDLKLWEELNSIESSLGADEINQFKELSQFAGGWWVWPKGHYSMGHFVHTAEWDVICAELGNS